MKNILGKTFGRLTVIREAGRSKFRQVLWLCRCECGNETTVPGGDLRRGHTTSCGCQKGWPKGTPDYRNHRGESNGAAKLTSPEQVHEIRRLYSDGEIQRVIGGLFGLKQPAVSSIIVKRNWAHV